MEKLGEVGHGTRGLLVPKGVDADRYMKAKSQKAVMNATITEGGSVLVDCPYCILYYRTKNPVDVTAFVDRDGKRETKAECSKGHVLSFTTIDQWREERQKMGLQVRA